MAYPGTKSPRTSFPKDGDGDADTRLKQSPGSKCTGDENLTIGQPASKVGPAPTSRVYTRDYSKKGRDPDQSDLVTAALGNPFRL